MFSGYGVEFSIIIHLELYSGIGYRLPFGICHQYRAFGCRGIVVDYIDFRIVRSFVHDFLLSGIASEYFGMHQHATAGRSIKPAQVQYRFRFAGAEEVPFTIYPGFYPGMVCAQRGV